MRPWEEGTEPGALGRQGHPARNRRGANPRGRAADLASDHEVEPSGLRWARQPPASRSAAECLSETVGGACGPRHAGAEARRGRGQLRGAVASQRRLGLDAEERAGLASAEGSLCYTATGLGRTGRLRLPGRRELALHGRPLPSTVLPVAAHRPEGCTEGQPSRTDL